MLLGWLGNLKNKPKKVFINHGSDQVCDSFAKAVKEQYGFETEAPYNGSEYDLTENTVITQGNAVKIPKKPGIQKSNAVFERLVAAGNRLLAAIEKNRGTANKDLIKFTNQIDSLTDKWKH